jgi:NitT/TauT family transport system ATP-binding protein
VILTFQNVSFSYATSPEIILDGSFSIATGGERLFLVGPSGTGKSTLMKIALGLLPPISGTVNNQALRPIPIMQNFYASLLPWLNVRKNLLFGIDAERGASLETIVSLFEIDAYLQSRPTELSGGQLQRVLFARALCQQPDLMLVDEPLSHLDLPSSNRILTRLEAYLTEHKISVFWITHRHFEARVLAHRVIHLENQTLRPLQVHELAEAHAFTT